LFLFLEVVGYLLVYILSIILPTQHNSILGNFNCLYSKNNTGLYSVFQITFLSKKTFSLKNLVFKNLFCSLDELKSLYNHPS